MVRSYLYELGGNYYNGEGANLMLQLLCELNDIKGAHEISLR